MQTRAHRTSIKGHRISRVDHEHLTSLERLSFENVSNEMACLRKSSPTTDREKSLRPTLLKWPT